MRILMLLISGVSMNKFHITHDILIDHFKKNSLVYNLIIKQILINAFLTLLIVMLFFVSCKKDIDCDSCNVINKPPIAAAGPDQFISLPKDSTILDGSESVDPDGPITSFLWSKISGPASYKIINSYTVQTELKNLVEGNYLFELKVTDAGGQFSKDTMMVTIVKAIEGVYIDCKGNSRPFLNARLVPVSTLSITREGMAIAAAGNKILFAGGFTGNYSTGFKYYSRVDILDINTNAITNVELSEPRTAIATVVHGDKIFFAGGNVSTSVDIYNATGNSWSKGKLSIGRSDIAAGAAGNKVLFAAGIGEGFFWPHWPNPPLDIFDVSTNTWSANILPNRPTSDIIGHAGIATTTIGNKIYFAGNASDWFAWDFGSISSTINIYDAVTNTWSISDLSIPRGFMASIAVGNKNYWAGGLYKQPFDPFTTLVEIRDMNTNESRFDCLFQPNAFFSAVLKNNQIVFFTSGVNEQSFWSSVTPPVMNKFDIYDIASNTWSIGVLPVNIYGSAIISVNNTIYVAGGYVNGTLSSQVWKLEF